MTTSPEKAGAANPVGTEKTEFLAVEESALVSIDEVFEVSFADELVEDDALDVLEPDSVDLDFFVPEGRDSESPRRFFDPSFDLARAGSQNSTNMLVMGIKIRFRKSRGGHDHYQAQKRGLWSVPYFESVHWSPSGVNVSPLD